LTKQESDPLLTQALVAPAADAHHVKAFAMKDDLLYFACGILKSGAHVHPADLALRIAYDQHNRERLHRPIANMAFVLDPEYLRLVAFTLAQVRIAGFN
jgi:hypothetical protein